MKKMKEQTYGWYPSVRDIYLSKNQPTPYHLECLYKFRNSDYYSPMVDPPEPAFVIKAITPSPPPSRPATSRASSRQSGQSGKQRPKSVPVPKFRPVPHMSIPKPEWRSRLKETEWGMITPDSAYPGSPVPAATPVPEQETEAPGIEWPTQKILGKYDKPHVTIVTPTSADVFSSPLPPREPGMVGDSGYVFVPTGDGGVEVHSPPVYWPESNPRTPTPQHSASSRASFGSAEGIFERQKLEGDYKQQQLKQQEEKRQRLERQKRFEQILRKQQHQQQPTPPRSAMSDSATPSLRKERVQSAVQHRHKPPIPPRPAYSARPSRPASDTAVFTNTARTVSKTPNVASQSKTPVPAPLPGPAPETWREQPSPQTRPMNPLPPTPSEEDLLYIQEDRSPSPDYQTIVDTYGWRAEVHGDPYNIKKTTKRLPYYVKCDEPVLAPEPPKVHMESKDTFFLNTIPRRRATFDVAQDWISEGLHAQRIELQKREGVNYRYKTFSFAY